MEIYIPVKCKDGVKTMPFSWELLVHGCTREMQEMINAFRLEYAKQLKEHIKTVCNELCSPEYVGTTENVTAVSDIDINLTFSKDIKENLQQINTVFESIKSFNKKFIKDDYSHFFDINIYGTHFNKDECNNENCIDILITSHNQRLWAFSRLAQVFKEHKIKFNNQNNQKASILLDDVRKTIDMIESRKLSAFKSYIILLKKYFSNTNDFKQAIMIFSLSKFFENETYRSVGAYLHIVNGMKDLPYILYLDSTIDNLGFLAENILKSNKCVEIPFDWKILRVAKYMQRVTNAIILALNNKSLEVDSKIKALNGHCEILNNARKLNSPINQEAIQYFLDDLSTYKNNKDFVLDMPLEIPEQERDLLQLLVNFTLEQYQLIMNKK